MAVIKNPIRCPKCNTIVVEDEKSLQFFVLQRDITCPNCVTIVVSVPSWVNR